jgi:spermidine/putrescine transport system permease protein
MLKRQTRTLASLLAPAYLWLALTIFLPLSAMLYFSFLTVAPIGGRVPEVTLANYTAFFTKEVYWYNAWRSFELATWVTLLCLLVAWPAAYALSRHVAGRSREALFLLLVLPFWSNALVRTFSWTMVLRGPWDILFSYPAIVIGLVHAYLPYAILTIYISLQAIEDNLAEAASTLGASPWRVFTRITFPLSLPGALAGALLIFVPVTGSFMEPRILGGKSAIMLGPIIENQFTATFNWPLGAALSFTMLAIMLVGLGILSPFLARHLRQA